MIDQVDTVHLVVLLFLVALSAWPGTEDKMERDHISRRDEGTLIHYGICGHVKREWRGRMSPQLELQIQQECSTKRCPDCQSKEDQANRPRPTKEELDQLWD